MVAGRVLMMLLLLVLVLVMLLLLLNAVKWLIIAVGQTFEYLILVQVTVHY